MAGVASNATGVMLLFAAGIVITFNVSASQIVRSWGWPFFRIMGTLSLIIACVIACVLLLPCSGPSFSCKRGEIKWVILRGFCGASSFLFTVCAVSVGATVGDVGAMSSINMVAASLFGHFFLGEALGLAHIGAVLLSILGALLISNPVDLVYNFETRGVAAVLGYFLALLGGTMLGYVFICTRKTGTASVWLLTFSAMAQRGLLFWIMELAGFVDDGAVEALSEVPTTTALMLSVMFFTTFGGNFLASAGSKLCPAAISATVTTAMNMSVGYVAQVALFGQKPAVLTLVGAFMMFMAVVIMSFSRLPPKPINAHVNVAQLPAGSVPEEVSTEASTASESLVEFIASEFAQEPTPSPINATPLPSPVVSVRQRNIPPTTVGSLTAVHG